MSLDATESKILTRGTVRVDLATHDVIVEGFDGHGCTCRDIAVLAMIECIEVLSEQIRLTVQRPGGGNVVVD